MHEPTTPAGLPRNREAEMWRERYSDVSRAWWILAATVAFLFVVLTHIADQRDAARAQVAAAEQRAERAEARNAENTCGHHDDVGRMRKQVCVRAGGCFHWWSMGDTPPLRVIYDPPSTQWRGPVPINLNGGQP